MSVGIWCQLETVFLLDYFANAYYASDTKESSDIHDVPNDNAQNYNNSQKTRKLVNYFSLVSVRNWGCYKFDDGVNKYQRKIIVES